MITVHLAGHASVLREVRANPLPPVVGAHLAPDTDSATLAGLAGAIEASVAEDRLKKASPLAMDTASVFEQAAPAGEGPIHARGRPELINRLAQFIDTMKGN